MPTMESFCALTCMAAARLEVESRLGLVVIFISSVAFFRKASILAFFLADAAADRFVNAGVVIDGLVSLLVSFLSPALGVLVSVGEASTAGMSSPLSSAFKAGLVSTFSSLAALLRLDPRICTLELPEICRWRAPIPPKAVVDEVLGWLTMVHPSVRFKSSKLRK